MEDPSDVDGILSVGTELCNLVRNVVLNKRNQFWKEIDFCLLFMHIEGLLISVCKEFNSI